jgi:hypothetical protein
MQLMLTDRVLFSTLHQGYRNESDDGPEHWLAEAEQRDSNVSRQQAIDEPASPNPVGGRFSV